MNNKDYHEIYRELMEMGATEEDIIELFKIAYKTIDKIIDKEEA
jgi:transcription initiation factor IIE alpha subunit